MVTIADLLTSINRDRVDVALAELRGAAWRLERAVVAGAQPAAALSTARERTLDAIAVLETATAPTATPGAQR